MNLYTLSSRFLSRIQFIDLKPSKGIIYLMLFSTVTAINLYFLEFASRKMTDSGNYYCKLVSKNNPGSCSSQAYIRRVLDLDKNIQNIVIGDSQVGGQAKIEDFASLGIGGISFYEQERVIQFVFRYRKPDEVILGVGPQLLAKDRQTSDFVRLPKNSFSRQILPWPFYVLEPGLTPGMPLFLKDAVTHTSISETVQSSSFRDWMKQMNAEHWGDIPPEIRLERTLARVKEQTPVPLSHQSIGAQRLEKTLIFLKQKGANVCLVRPPVTEEYLAYEAEISPERFRESEEVYKELAQKHHIPYVDFRDLDFRQSLSHFANQDHLNAQGHRFFWPKAHQACFG
ncbi:SGNH/GDSL hydrolase family protein [Geitlerinema sp. PCC 7407]|uniref:SGNH/GDSL hydrolase family protein n=1 Tax=Geitlerinema sp. PCC 7407 TaxID=1173025 RepID=UPI00029FBA44|nr:SGNH/GDSL hydrolase family protein [Geitlerinema sp. PCC 7407]AFY67910.1 hypothetical protein GEI7407_3443 [Geitlerinema sp. PCC 7407]